MPYYLLLAMVCAAGAPDWREVEFGEKTILLDPRCEPLETSPLGPFVKLGDGSVLAVDNGRVLVSGDEGKTAHATIFQGWGMRVRTPAQAARGQTLEARAKRPELL